MKLLLVSAGGTPGESGLLNFGSRETSQDTEKHTKGGKREFLEKRPGSPSDLKQNKRKDGAQFDRRAPPLITIMIHGTFAPLRFHCITQTKAGRKEA